MNYFNFYLLSLSETHYFLYAIDEGKKKMNNCKVKIKTRFGEITAAMSKNINGAKHNKILTCLSTIRLN